MNIGDVVLYKNQKVKLVSKHKPACSCKGKGHYVVHYIDGNFRKEIPIDSKFEPINEVFEIKQEIKTHSII